MTRQIDGRGTRDAIAWAAAYFDERRSLAEEGFVRQGGLKGIGLGDPEPELPGLCLIQGSFPAPLPQFILRGKPPW